MAAAELHIHRLRLPAQAAGVGAQGRAARIEDALRVSSKPAALAHRHVLVRRLRLAAAHGASAQSLALLFERAWQRIAAEAQPIASAPAAADAVWAADETAARVALIDRWAQGGDSTAWFWARVQGRVQGAHWAHRAAALMLALPDQATGTAADRRQLALVHEGLAAIAARGALPEFLLAVDDRQAEALADCLATAADGLQAGPSSLPPGDAAGPGRVVLGGAGRRRLAAALQGGRARSQQRPGEGPGTAPARPPFAAAVAPATTAPARRAGAVAARAQASDVIDSTPAFVAATANQPTPHASPNAAPGEGLASGWAGLWLLLPLLLRLGLDDSASPLALLAATLQSTCTRFGVPADDAVQATIAALDAPPIDAALAAAWLRRGRVAAWRETRLPLRRIVRRGGVVWVSATRVDIEFPLAAADLRIRRAGFDLDPGFLPWLGRVVHFHYV